MSRTYSVEEVSKHTAPTDLLLIIDGKVYDVSDFKEEHPGGEDFLLDQAGKDVTELFEDAGHSPEAREILSTLTVGTIPSDAPSRPIPVHAQEELPDAYLRVCLLLAVVCMVAGLVYLRF
ncbi:cytochrome b5-like heme/steroid binding domain-containing protein [Aspergillus pseudoustus]|uniref:Cytochrome b5-like heme/steroid binding domain-containing protein n=1 Tax=Aspergillus pseudoustus TaxID=1810923 RepID=A0ABR4IG61_9EURO